MEFKAIVFLPLLGALIAGFFGRWITDRGAEIITTALLLTSAALSWFVFWRVGFGGETIKVPIANWITSGELEIAWSLRIDTLTAVMLVVVTTVSSLVHVYSIGYMHEDDARARFFAYLSLFTFAMLMLVTADNLVQMFFGWEGVGLASYLLIGFWFKKPSANAAAIKAFVVNRVGDFGFALGIFALVRRHQLGQTRRDFSRSTEPGRQDDAVPRLQRRHSDMHLCLLLFMGAMGKSAQFLLHTWLPDAMEGPTPVSALIHAATMVTAGVFMVARLSPVFEYAPTALVVVTAIGAINGVLRRNRRPRSERHQARHRLFDMLAARLHVRCLRCRRLFRRHLPPLHARLLQGAAVPWRRFRHPRHASRTGHAQHGRSRTQDPHDLGHDADRHAGSHRRRHSRISVASPASTPRTPSSKRPSQPTPHTTMPSGRWSSQPS